MNLPELTQAGKLRPLTVGSKLFLVSPPRSRSRRQRAQRAADAMPSYWRRRVSMVQSLSAALTKVLG